MPIIDLDSVPSIDGGLFDYADGDTVAQLEEEITGLEKAVSSTKAAKAKWIKLLDLANRASTAKKRSTRQERISGSEKDSLGNAQSLSEFINSSATGLAQRIAIFRSTANGRAQQYTRSYSRLLEDIKTKKGELENLRQEIAETGEATAKAGAARAVESGAKTKNVFMYVIFGVVIIIAIVLIIRIIKK